jgi:hypothetical protein
MFIHQTNGRTDSKCFGLPQPNDGLWIEVADDDPRLLPQPPTPAQLLEEKAVVLKTFVTLRATMIGVLSAIAGKKDRKAKSVDALACDNACDSLLAIESTPAFIAATDGPTAQAAILSAYQVIAATLSVASPDSAAEFVAMGLTYP